jgi:ABC-type lipoprotein release transport system permease subunit
MQLGTYAHMVKNSVSFYSGYIQIHAPEYWDKRSLDQTFILDDKLAQAVLSQKHIRFATPRLETFALVSGGDITDGAMINGVIPENEDRLNGLKTRIVAGKFLDSLSPGIMLAQGLAKHLKVTVGDTVVVLGQGYHGITAANKYAVEGIVKFPMPELDTRLAYLTLKEAQNLNWAEDRITSYTIMIDKQKNLDRVMNALKDKFLSQYEIMTWEEMQPELVQYIEMDNASGIITLYIIYLIIAFGILGTILMMTLERQREFGMLIAIGMKRMRLRFIVVLESLLLSLVGVITGMIVGVPLLLYYYYHPIVLKGEMAEMMLEYGFEPVLPFSMEPSIFFWQGVTVFIIAIGAVLYPLWKISQIKPVDALKTN